MRPISGSSRAICFFGLEKFQREIDDDFCYHYHYYCVQLSEKKKIYLINSTLTKPRSSSHIYLTKEKFDYNFKKKKQEEEKICIVDQTNTSANAEQITINKCENKLSKNETIKHDNFCVFVCKISWNMPKERLPRSIITTQIFLDNKNFSQRRRANYMTHRVCCVLR